MANDNCQGKIPGRGLAQYLKMFLRIKSGFSWRPFRIFKMRRCGDDEFYHKGVKVTIGLMLKIEPEQKSKFADEEDMV